MSMSSSSASLPPITTMIAGCDSACAHADLDTLAHHTQLLALCVAEPLRHELLEVARCCVDATDLATARWSEAREHLRSHLREVDPALHASA